jgi:hypothetical protein
LISIANFLHDLKYRLAYTTNISIVNSNTTKNERDIVSTDVLKLSNRGTAIFIFIAAILVVSGSNVRSAFADNVVHSVDDSVSDGTVTLAPGQTPSKYNVLTSQPTIILPNPRPPANTAPQLQLPRNVDPIEGNTPGGATFTYIVSAVDSEYGPYPTPRCNPESGSTFPLGTTTVNCQVTDLGGLSDHGSFTVTVVDTKPPEWPANLQLNNILFKTAQPTVQVSYTTPRGTDIVDGPIDATCSLASGSSFHSEQTTTISCILKDNTGNQNPETKSFTVQVMLSTIPFPLQPVDEPVPQYKEEQGEKRKIWTEEQPQENSIISLGCHPSEINIAQGTKGSLSCTIQNKSLKAVELILGCSGLSGTGIECLINGESSQTGTILVGQLSDKNFPLLIGSRSSPPVPVGLYPFTISAVCATENVSC